MSTKTGQLQFSDKRLVTTLVLCGSFALFALKATTCSDGTTPTPTTSVEYNQPAAAPIAAQRPYTSNGIYILMDSNNVVRYVGRGDVHSRINAHLGTPGKSHLNPYIVWGNDLTWYEKRWTRKTGPFAKVAPT